MPESSGESTPSSNEQAGGPRPTAPAGEPSPLPPAPRAHPSAVQHAKASAKTPPPPPGSRAILDWLRQYGNLDLDPDDAMLTETREDLRSAQARLPREQRKFHKFDPEHQQQASASASGAAYAGETASGRTDTDSFSDDSLQGITAQQIAAIHRLRENPSERRLWIALGIAVLAFLAVTVAFLANRASTSKSTTEFHEPAAAPSTVADPAVTIAPLTPGVIELLDRATVAEMGGDYPKAIQLFKQAQHEAGHIYGLNYHLASVCYKANEMMQVLPLLNLSISEREEVAACYSLRGSLLNQSEGTLQEPSDLEKATRLEPLNGRFFFVWGEALRSAGKPELALPQLRRASERMEESALAAEYALKLRLTQIELDQGDSLDAGIAEKLKENPPSSDWLLTCAALEMQRGEYPAAAQTLEKLRTQFGEREVVRQLKDVFFKRFARQPELTRFFDAPVSP